MVPTLQPSVTNIRAQRNVMPIFFRKLDSYVYKALGMKKLMVCGLTTFD